VSFAALIELRQRGSRVSFAASIELRQRGCNGASIFERACARRWAVSKDRARPFSRKHRKYWIPVTGGMILIGLINLAIGFCAYTRPPEVFERIVPDVPFAQNSAALPPPRAVACPPAIGARIEAEVPGATIIGCSAERVTVMRGPRKIEFALVADEIREVTETLALPEIPADVMRAFAVAYPRTIPSAAIKRTQRGGEPVYELTFPPGATHAVAILRPDGSVVDVR
jgi:hypothetical protein